ncbi:hypothetical protein BLA29_011363 [Euroglyphus maynei]|uniref:Amino acid transporter transmembrane domain-containing protein n=1 Tax=Euroglyphus maynei TaxID=6958 RepID=A0A1Y3APL9_EURMA|nr:hypothetical protein BLA29_011363 [Euroglyphus maynei]
MNLIPSVILAASIPELDLIIELIGAFACTSVAIIIPTVLHLVIFYERKNGLAKKWLIIRNTTILIFGFLVLCTGTYFSLTGIVERFQTNSVDNNIVISTTTPFIAEDNNNVTEDRLPFWFDKLINLTTNHLTVNHTYIH